MHIPSTRPQVSSAHSTSRRGEGAAAEVVDHDACTALPQLGGLGTAPSTSSSFPAIHDDAGDAKNKAAEAMSSGGGEGGAESH